MSLKSRSELLLNQFDAEMAKPDTPRVTTGPRTAVGQMVAKAADGLRGELNQSIAELESVARDRDKARAELSEIKARVGDALREVDPTRIAPSPIARRIKQSFEDVDFQNLCEDITRIGGNITPVLVRTYTGTAVDKYDFEVIAGHRRRAACEKLDRMVTVIVKEVDDLGTIRLMASENDNRVDESRYELGLHYQALIDRGLLNSIREIAEHTSKSRTVIQRCMRMAVIPSEIVSAFSDPREIRLEWVEDLINAWANDRAGVLSRIHTLVDSAKKQTSLATYKAVTHIALNVIKPETIHIDSKPVMKIVPKRGGRISFDFEPQAPSDFVAYLTEAARTWRITSTGKGSDV